MELFHRRTVKRRRRIILRGGRALKLVAPLLYLFVTGAFQVVAPVALVPRLASPL
ncbi:hypothetical protein ACFQ0M_07880 [Kitasatospora aburaviensis]